MAQNLAQMLRGSELQSVLKSMSLRFDAPAIKWFADGAMNRISPAMALLIARAAQYEGKVRNGRVVFIRVYEDRRANTFDPLYRFDRPMLQPMPMTGRTVDIWDQHFERKAMIARLVQAQAQA